MTTLAETPARTDRRLSPLSRPGLAFVLIGALVLCWPAVLNGGPFTFPDSGVYLRTGGLAVDAVARMLAAPFEPSAAPTTGAEGAGAAGPARPESLSDMGRRTDTLRSVPYAIFAHVAASTPLQRFGVAFAQGALVLAMLWPLVAAAVCARPQRALVVAALLALATPAAWYAAFLMPDILGAVVVAFALVLVSAVDRLDRVARLVLAGLAGFAIATHYGNIPVAAAAIATALALRFLRRRLTPGILALGLAPLLLALAVNATIGAFAARNGEISLTPLRLPILLARSIHDGPARWHLEEHCPEAGYATCEVFGERIPRTVGDALWARDGLSKVGRERLDAIRDEELTILWRAFLEYPGTQTWSFVGHGVSQFFMVGANDRADWIPRWTDRWLLAIHLGALLALGIAAAAARRRDPASVDLALTLFVALAVNAAVFGGLSAPVDRYQARIAWLAPVLAALVVSRRMTDSSRTPDPGAPETRGLDMPRP